MPTDTQEEILDFIIEFKTKNDGDSPTVDEIAHAIGKSKSVAYYWLERLEESDKITVDRGRKLIFRVPGYSYRAI